MYGTIARMKIKPGAEEKFREYGQDGPNRVPGVVFEYIYKLDSGSNDYILVVGFESKEAYVKNANSPEQHQRYLEYRELLEADPEWSDGEVIYAHPAS